jgi:GH15 family glucan-1,4-alpha-glucosidase
MQQALAGRDMKPGISSFSRHFSEPSPRDNGYAPLRSYAAIGDGRTVALVADDGTIEWLPLPNLDSPPVLDSLLDAGTGGYFRLAPDCPFEVTRRYLPDTNVLETTFSTASGVVRLLDAMTVQGTALGPFRELQRRVEVVSGHVQMRWQLRPRFGFGEKPTWLGRRSGFPVATSGSDALAVCAFSAGDVKIHDDVIGATFLAESGSPAVIALCMAHQEPLLFPTRQELEDRFQQTVDAWAKWAATRTYEGRWRDAVLRSALALKLLMHSPSGAIAAAATTSLPEELGGERNWDYRFCWVRDAAFTVDALLRLGCVPEAQAYFWWLVHASQLTRPRWQPLYRLDGGARSREQTLQLDGYRRSRPVRVGNAAAEQLQLDTYGEVLETAWLYAEAGECIDRDIGRQLGQTADLVCQLWREPDAGIWEVRSAPRHFTQSKMMCWIALDRAGKLAERGLVPAGHATRWFEQASAIRDFVEQRCFSEQLGSYVRSADSEEMDASVLLGLLSGYGDARSTRWADTVLAVRRELGHGPYLYRYTGVDGLSGGEGAFLTCSFWLAEALARTGRAQDGAALMDELVGLSNDVGLYAEEIDPNTGAFLGNLPQGLSHLSLISAATAIRQESAR